MLGKRIINTGADSGAACTTDTVQILDGVPFQSIATYELDGDATNLVDTGYINKAAVFNGSNSRILSNIGMGSNSSVSLWIKFNSIPSTQKEFLDWGSSSTGRSLRLNTYNSNQIRFSTNVDEFYYSGVTTGVWYHLVYSGDGKCFVNNVLVDTLSVNTSTTEENLYLGSNNDLNRFSDCSIDQVRIFNKALSSSEVTTLYGETSASSTKSTTDIFADSSGLALYELEGNANDTGGTYNGTATNVVYNEYDGTASNVTYSTGQFGQAGVFNGSSSKIAIPNVINFTKGEHTISAWVNFADTTTSRFISNFYTGTIPDGSFDFVWIPSSNSINIDFKVGGSNYTNTITGISTNTWYHIVVTFVSNGTCTAYLNGSSVDTVVAPSFTNTSFQALNLGYYSRGDDYWSGSIDQVRIYDKAISASDVTTLYNETVATASTNITLEVPSLVAYYKMNDATDETGSYDGTPTNVNFNVAGKFGNAGSFNGSSSYIDAGQINFGANNVSVSLWVHPNSSQNAYANIIDYNHSSSGGWTIQQDNTSTNSYKVTVYNGSSYNVSSAFSLTANQWNHVVFTVTSAGAYNIYVDNGTPTTGTGLTGLSTSTNNNLNIGRWYTGTSRYWGGKLDQIRIFDRAITSDEVETLYNEVYCQPTIVPTDHFEPVIYTGNGSSQSISTLDFAPDFVWMKDRDTTNYEHVIFDSVRGTGTSHILSSDLTSQEGWSTNGSLTSFDSNGFTLPNTVLNNANGHNYVAWNWKAGGDDVAANSIEATNATRSANVDAGFSIIKFQSSASTASPPPMNYIEHGLDATPEMVIYKKTSEAQSWVVQSAYIQQGQALYLDLTNGVGTNNATGFFDNTSTSIGVRANFAISRDDSYIAYAFHSVDGMSKFGSYVGNGASNSIVTGFRPAFVMIKRTSASGSSWAIFDNKRGVGEPSKVLYANLSDSEYSDNLNDIEFSSNGFTLLDNNEHTNYSSNTYIFMAFAEENVQPQPVLANSFNTVTYTGNGGTQAINTVGFQPDLVWIKDRTSANSHILQDSVRGANKALLSNATSAEITSTDFFTSFDSNGFTLPSNTGQQTNKLNNNYVAWCWKASNESTINQDGSITSIVSANPAAGFSVVKYTGTGSLATVGHGLSSTPELFIIKNLDDSTRAWLVYDKFNTATNNMTLNTSSATNASSAAYNNTEPTSTVFTVNTSTHVNALNNEHIAYCFHSVDGYQKVGSYSGSGGAGNKQTIGFKPSFLMIKLTNGGGSWWIFDSARTPNDPRNLTLRADTSDTDYNLDGVDFENDGFSFNSLYFNESGSNFIYLAIKAN